jgi:histone H3/H4
MRSSRTPKKEIGRILRHCQPDMKVKDEVKALMYLNYLLFLKRLLQEASVPQHQFEQKKKLTADDIERVSKRVLQEFRG